MITFSLQTFLKICILDTGSRISELQKRLEGNGGYDFHKSFQQAVRLHANGGAPDQVNALLSSPSNDVERRYNTASYQKFGTKYGNKRSLEAIDTAKFLTFRDAGLKIKVDPLFSLEVAGTREIYCTWQTQKPPMSQRYGAVACHVMREAFRSSGLANGQCRFVDFVGDKVYSEKQITNNTSLILNEDARSIGNLLKEL